MFTCLDFFSRLPSIPQHVLSEQFFLGKNPRILRISKNLVVIKGKMRRGSYSQKQIGFLYLCEIAPIEPRR